MAVINPQIAAQVATQSPNLKKSEPQKTSEGLISSTLKKNLSTNTAQTSVSEDVNLKLKNLVNKLLNQIQTKPDKLSSQQNKLNFAPNFGNEVKILSTEMAKSEVFKEVLTKLEQILKPAGELKAENFAPLFKNSGVFLEAKLSAALSEAHSLPQSFHNLFNAIKSISSPQIYAQITALAKQDLDPQSSLNALKNILNAQKDENAQIVKNSSFKTLLTLSGKIENFTNYIAKSPILAQDNIQKLATTLLKSLQKIQTPLNNELTKPQNLAFKDTNFITNLSKNFNNLLQILKNITNEKSNLTQNLDKNAAKNASNLENLTKNQNLNETLKSNLNAAQSAKNQVLNTNLSKNLNANFAKINENLAPNLSQNQKPLNENPNQNLSQNQKPNSTQNQALNQSQNQAQNQAQIPQNESTNLKENLSLNKENLNTQKSEISSQEKSLNSNTNLSTNSDKNATQSQMNAAKFYDINLNEKKENLSLNLNKNDEAKAQNQGQNLNANLAKNNTQNQTNFTQNTATNLAQENANLNQNLNTNLKQNEQIKNLIFLDENTKMPELENLSKELSRLANRANEALRQFDANAQNARINLADIKNLEHKLNEASRDLAKIAPRDVSQLSAELKNDIKSTLLQSVQIAKEAGNEAVANQANRLLAQIEFNQLLSLANDSLNANLPLFWEDLNESRVSFKRGKKDKYYAQIKLGFAKLGQLDILIALKQDKYLDINIMVENKAFRALIYEHSHELKRALNKVGLMSANFFVGDIVRGENAFLTPKTERNYDLQMGIDKRA